MDSTPNLSSRNMSAVTIFGFQLPAALFHVFLFLIAVVNGTQFLRLKLANPYMMGGDAKRGLYWLVSLQDPSLFRECIFTQVNSFFVSTLGFKFVYWIILHFLSLSRASVFVMIMLYGVSAYLLFLIGKKAVSFRVGIVSFVVFLLHEPYMEYFFSDGLAKAFAFPVLLFFVYAVLSDNIKLILFSFALACLFQPVVVGVSYLLFVIWLIRKRAVSVMYCFVPLMFVGLAVVYRGLTKPAMVGPLLNWDFINMNPKFLVLLGEETSAPLHLMWHHLQGIIPFPYFPHMGIMVVGILYFLVQKNRRVNNEKVAFIAFLFPVSLMSWLLAYPVMMEMYFPSRQYMYTFPILIILFISIGFEVLIKYTSRYVGYLLLAAALVTRLFSSSDSADLKLLGTLPPEMATFIHGLPAEVVIAADPRIAQDIPLFCQRKVYFDPNFKGWLFPTFDLIVRQREIAVYEALYSRDLQKVEFLRKAGVDYLIIDRESYRSAGSIKNLSPSLDIAIREFNTQRSIAYLMALEKQGYLMRFGPYSLIRLS